MDQTLDIEQRSLQVAKWSNLAMAVIGVVAGLVAYADALVLDGLFSGLNFATAIAAVWVARSVQRPPDAARPFGYEIDETIYVMFRSMLLIGILLMAFFSALNQIVTYWLTGNATTPALGWITAYVALMVVVCFGLAAYHHRNWRRTERKSTLLRTESRAVLIDGLMSAGAGAAFIGIAFLQGGRFDWIVPISDALVVVLLCLVILPQPFGMFHSALGDLAGVSLPAAELVRIRSEALDRLSGMPFELLDASGVRSGRTVFVLFYLKPFGAVTLDEIEDAREALSSNSKDMRAEVIMTGQSPLNTKGKA